MVLSLAVIFILTQQPAYDGLGTELTFCFALYVYAFSSFFVFACVLGGWVVGEGGRFVLIKEFPKPPPNRISLFVHFL